MVEIKRASKRLKGIINSNPKYHFAKSAINGFGGRMFANKTKNADFWIISISGYLYIVGDYSKDDLQNLLLIRNLLGNISHTVIAENDDLVYIKSETSKIQSRFNFDYKSLDVNHLDSLISNIDTQEIEIKLLSTKAQFDQLIEYKKFFNVIDKPTYKDYKKYNIVTYIAYDKDKIVGAMGSNIIYSDGLETQLFVSEEYRGRKLATKLSALFCKNLLLNKRVPYWDAANEISAKLAKKLGYTLIEEYKVLSYK